MYLKHKKSILTESSSVVAALVISSLISFISTSCNLDSVTPVQVVINPYDFKKVDLESAQLKLFIAQQNKDTLEKIGQQLRSNPYQFKQGDINYTNSLLQQVRLTEDRLRYVLSSGNFEFFFEYYHIIPSLSQVEDGKTYWLSEKTKIDSLTKPYWQKEHRVALMAQYTVWIDFCTRMISNLNFKIEMIDTILSDLDHDKAILNNNSSETAIQILNRKIALEQLKIRYYSDLVGVLNAAIVLKIPHWPSLSKFIPSTQQIERGRSFWLAEIDSTENIKIPYWQEQIKLARNSGNGSWVDFCAHMMNNLNEFINLGRESMNDLEHDMAFINSTSSETLPEVLNRKKNLVSRQVAYYRDLIQVIAEGMALGTLQR